MAAAGAKPDQSSLDCSTPLPVLRSSGPMGNLQSIYLCSIDQMALYFASETCTCFYGCVKIVKSLGFRRFLHGRPAFIYVTASQAD